MPLSLAMARRSRPVSPANSGARASALSRSATPLRRTPRPPRSVGRCSHCTLGPVHDSANAVLHLDLVVAPDRTVADHAGQHPSASHQPPSECLRVLGAEVL